MGGGLEGRRIALVVPAEATTGRADVVRRALEQQGAQVDALSPGQGDEEAWHGGRYAALVAIGRDGTASSTADDPRLLQLIREFLVSEKPVAAIGTAVDAIVRSGGAAGSFVSATSDSDDKAFAENVIRTFSALLDERDVDEMSEQSFPASDPPATTPASIGPAPEQDTGTRT